MSETRQTHLFDPARALAAAKDALVVETDALTAIATRLEPSFAAVVQAVLSCHGRVVVMGMGKSGHIGRKIAATLASTGTPAMLAR